MASVRPGARRESQAWEYIKKLPTASSSTIAASVCLIVLAAMLPHASASDRWKEAIATVFWVGEAGTADNRYIPNLASAWDRNWMAHFGGVDDPKDRCGFEPCAFTPKENPFYIALPYDDMTEAGSRKASAAAVPWESKPGRSALKNRWIAVRANGHTCYAQWQDVGPFESDDIAYVFGDAAEPRNKQIAAAGIDLSPAVRDCLQVEPVSHVAWRHVEAQDVPEGPWRKVVTTRPGP
jgi:hypothetical protein